MENTEQADSMTDIIRKLKMMYRRHILRSRSAIVSEPFLEMIWYEDDEGKIQAPSIDQIKNYDNPKDAVYQLSRIPCRLDTMKILIKPDGTSGARSTMTEGYPPDLALALTNSGDFTLGEAIIFSATVCERCMNALAYEYGLDWGYPVDSQAYATCGTSCKLCKQEATPFEEQRREGFPTMEST